MRTTLFLIRHGETEWSRDDLFSGVTDIPLTEAGRQQAEALARRLSRLPISIEAAYCSPLTRAAETGGIIARELGLVAQPVGELAELDYGAWEGLKRADTLARYPKEYARWDRNPFSQSPPGGETGRALVNRVVPAIWRLVTAHPNGAVVVVAHKAVNRVVICSLMGIPVRNYRFAIVQSPACLNVLSFNAAGAVSLVKLNDTSHYRE